LVHGIVKNNGEIRKPIREFGSGRMGIDERNGKPSATKYNVIKQLNNLTLLELNPSTGRRHQLRVHLYSIGHPIVGDLRYGDKEVQEKYPRLMLHAKSIEFELPDDKKMFVESKIPESFQNILDKLGLKGINYEKNE
jgi:23S rRNA-/tRNA-specific pseudouridylate synthase